jgi:DNA mismatch endonuclease (patch repair protein)
MPKTNRAFWVAKFAANRRRDEEAQAKLENMGFAVVIIWECEAKVMAHAESTARIEALESCRQLLTIRP